MVKCLSIVLGVLLGFNTSAQNAVIKGTISTETGKPAMFVNVHLKGTTKGATTNNDGIYFINKINPGKYILVASSIGFKTVEKNIRVQSDEITEVNFIMEENAQELKSVEIIGQSKAQDLRESANAVNVIETKEVKFQSADLGEVMAKAEGVSVQREGGLGSNTRIALNGLSDDKIRFFYNGIPLDFTLYSFGIANVPVNAINRVEIYKGVVPIQFGADALGGAINLVSPIVYNGWSGAASYQVGTFNTHRLTGNIAYANDSSGLFVTASGFYDYTNNNYKIDVAIPNENGKLKQETVSRFHDGYQAVGANLKFGIRDKKWANELSVEGYYGTYYNEIQNSQAPGLIDFPELGIEKAVAGNPFGNVVFTSFSQGLNLNYNVNPAAKWAIDLNAGFNYNERVSIDTSHNLYNWFGEVVFIRNQAGEFGIAEHLITKSHNYFVRHQVGYKISKNHRLKLAIAPTYTLRTGDDLLIEGEFDPALDKGYLFDFVTGLEYSGELFKGKLQFISFVKNYRQNIRIEGIDPSLEGLQVDDRQLSNYGAGSGFRLVWTPRFSTKLSYEFAYRMPRIDEIFGDGQLVGSNLDLGPENSQNVNLQWDFKSKSNNKITWHLEGNFFVRKINDLIFLMVDPTGFGVFQNIWSATSQGLELGGKLKNIVKGLSLNANTTLQSYLNTSDEGAFVSFKGDRIPNTPYFFANGGAVYELSDLIKKSNRLSFFWNARYVHPFFIGWESAGLPLYKAATPSQLMHAAGFTQYMKFKKINTALTIEMQNITNAKVFDLFGVQRPGRAFFIKLNTQL